MNDIEWMKLYREACKSMDRIEYLLAEIHDMAESVEAEQKAA